MQFDDAPPTAPPGALPLLLAAGLQDQLLMATNELDRLQRLLHDASESLMLNFHGANQKVAELAAQADSLPMEQGEAVRSAMQSMARAITALQFQDMAWQLINHTTRRLQSCADQLALEAMGVEDDEEELVPDMSLRPNPVAQDEMDAGSVELF